MDEAKQERSEPERFALVAASLIFGALSIFAPAYFDAAGWQETAFHVGGVLFALLGSVGLAIELGRLTANEALSDFGAAAVLLVIALFASLAVETWSTPSPFAGLLRILVALSLFFGIYGIASGIEKLVRRPKVRRTSIRDGWTKSTLPLILGLLAVVTAIANLYAAFQAVPRK